MTIWVNYFFNLRNKFMNYRLCDCCKKFKPEDELEECVITIKKCSDCDISKFSQSEVMKTFSFPPKPQNPLGNIPPNLREAFIPPAGMEAEKVVEAKHNSIKKE
jgi:hypothetical protein